MKNFMMSAALFLCSTIGAFAQNFNQAPVYYAGSGSDTAYLVIDFQDQTFDTSYVWGYKYNGSTNGQSILSDVAADDINLDVTISGGVLSEINYGQHAGVNGTNGNNWSTWTGANINALNTNGLSSGVNNQEIFACSFTNTTPPDTPGMPIAAFDSTAFTSADVAYWYGSGSDSTVLVIDFHNGEQPVAFGYLSDGTGTAEDMMDSLSAYDVNLDIVFSGGFLDEITYNDSTGTNGTNGQFWGTWTATNMGNWYTNMGVGETLSGLKYFGCSFTDFNPNLRPEYPRTAIDPYLLSNTDVSYWVGQGQDTALFIVDFNDGNTPESYVWGYLFDESQTTTASDMMSDIAADDALLTVNQGVFLNDIIYDAQQGIAGNPNYWNTFSATNTGNWRSNTGIGAVLEDGDWFGTSYDGWPPSQPDVPSAAQNTSGLSSNNIDAQIYPNPVNNRLTVQPNTNEKYRYTLQNAVGKMIMNGTVRRSTILNTASLAQGIYFLKLVNNDGAVITQKIVKQ